MHSPDKAKRKAREDAARAAEYASGARLGAAYSAPFGPGAAAPRVVPGEGVRRRGGAPTTAGAAAPATAAAAPPQPPALASPPGRRKRRVSDAEGGAGAPGLMSPGSRTGEGKSPASAGSSPTRPLLQVPSAESGRGHRRMPTGGIPTGEETGESAQAVGVTGFRPLVLGGIDEGAGVGWLAPESDGSDLGSLPSRGVPDLDDSAFAAMQEVLAASRSLSRGTATSRETPGAQRRASVTAALPAVPRAAARVGRPLPRRSRASQAVPPMTDDGTLTSPDAQARMAAAGLAAARADGVAVGVAAAEATAARQRRNRNRLLTGAGFLVLVGGFVTLGKLLPGGGGGGTALSLPSTFRCPPHTDCYPAASLMCAAGCEFFNAGRVNATAKFSPATGNVRGASPHAPAANVSCESTFLGQRMVFDPAIGGSMLVPDVEATGYLKNASMTTLNCGGNAVLVFEPIVEAGTVKASAKETVIVGDIGPSPAPSDPPTATATGTAKPPVSQSATATASAAAPGVCVNVATTQETSPKIGQPVHLPEAPQLTADQCGTTDPIPLDKVCGEVGISTMVGPNGALPLQPPNAAWKCDPPPAPGVDAPQSCVISAQTCLDQAAPRLVEPAVAFNTASGGHDRTVELAFNGATSSTPLMLAHVRTSMEQKHGAAVQAKDGEVIVTPVS